METFNLWFSLIANAGVLAGIFFLVIEVRQNSRNLAAQVRATYFSSLADTWRIPAENKDLTEIMDKDFRNVVLSQPELWQVQAFWTRVQMAMEWGYKELPRTTFNQGLEFQKITFDMFPAYREAWIQRATFFDPAFYHYMNKNVFLNQER